MTYKVTKINDYTYEIEKSIDGDFETLEDARDYIESIIS